MLRGGDQTATGNADRGQTNLDFVIGVSIFVVAVVVAVTFVPDLVGGVAGTGQTDGVLADRVASDLANDRLGDPARPGQLRLDCTLALFSSSITVCGLDGGDLAANLEHASSVNVSLVYGEQACRDGGDVVPAGGSCSGDLLDRNVRACYDGDDERIRRESACDGDPGDVLLLGGPQPGTSEDTSIARRSVRLDDQHLILEVRAW
ncbi:DUF7287 family protein [Halomicrobium salinisoli]|uniref:DUF7287 family protein n=1 Tax=Halomicrobium salinisoli TaxID=2878391 RepID=UPI001CEFDB52|nr:hypothetical protein [Halomicrobium salinisoli]